MTATEVMEKINGVRCDEERTGVFINMFFFAFNVWEFRADNREGDFLHITSNHSTFEDYIGTAIDLDKITDIH